MKLKLKDYSILIIAIFAFSTTFAQYQISGKVVNNKGIPVENVEVYNANNGVITKTNTQGIYQINDVSKGTLKLIFFSYNYKIVEKEIKLINNKTLNISLDYIGEELSEVVINQRKRKVFALKRLKAVEGTAIYAGKKSEVVLLNETVGNKAANNARQIYSQVVGLNIYENDDAGLQLNIGGRGLDPNRTSNFNTRQNGYDISADVLGYPESYYTPPAEALQEIQVVRGAASLQYGTQFGGLLNFKLKQPHKTKEFELVTRQSAGSYGLINSFNSVSGTVGKTGYYAYANYKTGDGFRPNSKFNSINIYAHIDHKLSEKTTLTVEATYLNYLAKQSGGLTDTMFDENPTQSNRTRNWFRVNWNLWAVKLDHQFNENSVLNVNFFGLDASRKAVGYRGQYKFQTLNPIAVSDELLADNNYDVRDLVIGEFKNWGVETRFLSKYKFGNQKNIYLLGIKYYQARNSEKQGQGTRGSDADFNLVKSEGYHNSDFVFPNKNIAVFGEHIFNITDKIAITPGVRFEYIKTESNGTYKSIDRDGAGNPLLGGVLNGIDAKIKERNFLLLGIGASYKPSTSFEMYGNISQNYRSVTFNDIRTVSPSFVVDEFIDDEKGATTDIGIRGRWNNSISYDISGYGLYYNNRIGLVVADKGKNKGDRLRTNIGDAFIYGFESLVELNMANMLHFNKEYSLSVFNNLAFTKSEYIESIFKNVAGNEVEFIPFVNLKAGAKFGYKNFLSSLQFTHLSEQFTDATNANIDEKGSKREGTVGPIPSYSIVDASFSYAHKNWKLETGVNNLLNKNYFTRRATGYPGPGILPSSPRSYYVTLEFKF
ncbi:TonB-dependent receptor domain-containing protein [Tenacibaculum piscium]|uniref:TonB-dependent receptor domain-containing protein n=1 Tax=Tenacibaculum piscium TaxID=1458515 RepID=UPI001F383939|nr:TonB-dependent receptor [Tenacibaculum piscium]